MVTGATGFIDANLVKQLYWDYLDIKVVGVDNMNDYYDVHLKETRKNELKDLSSYIFTK